MKKPASSILKTVLVLSITALIFYLLFTKINFFSVLNILLSSDPPWLLVALLLSLLSLTITAKRWQTLLKTLGYDFQYKESFYLILGALPLALIAPLRAGDAIKAYYLKDKIPPSKTIGTVVAERIFDILCLTLFSLIGMIFCKRYELASIALIILACIMAIFILSHLVNTFSLPIKNSWNERIQNLILPLRLLTRHKRAFCFVFFSSLLIWFISIVQTLTFFYAVRTSAPVLFTMANIPIAIFIGLIPITLGGMGTRDAAIVFLFSEFATPEKLLGVGILFSIFRLWLLSLVGIPFMRKMVERS
jgi:uncharacterized protein (TIRG00374 family)